jgi:Phosphohistidine phosphatase SixA
MKRLYVLRHAKSSWDDASLADYDRPLNERGLKTAPFMGRLMRERGYLPDAVISSPANRARKTAKLASEAAGVRSPILFDEQIYEASPQTLVKVLSGVDDKAASAMVVGHNPGMEGLIRFLTGETAAMPTAALAVIDLDIENWSEIDHLSGKLVEVLRPKEVGYLT